MKKSEKLRLEAEKTDNDFKALSIYTKVLREERKEKFEDKWLIELKKIIEVTKRSNGSYTFSNQKYGIMDFYPKANKILIRKSNRWVKPGLRFIVNNILKYEIK